jgi:hypothetical protein
MVTSLTTIAHAIEYECWVKSGRGIPENHPVQIGTSIGDDPMQRLVRPAEPAIRSRAKHPRPSPAYLASETSFDGEEEEFDEWEPPSIEPVVPPIAGIEFRPLADRNQGAFRMRASNVPQPAPRTARMRPSSGPRDSGPDPGQPADTVGGADLLHETSAELATILAENPRALHLLRVATAGPIILRVAPPATEPPRRNRQAFTPHDVQVAIHQAIENPRYQGTLAATLVHEQLSSSAIVFIPYLSALMLLYEFGFGQRGLRLMHLS